MPMKGKRFRIEPPIITKAVFDGRRVRRISDMISTIIPIVEAHQIAGLPRKKIF